MNKKIINVSLIVLFLFFIIYTTIENNLKQKPSNLKETQYTSSHKLAISYNKEYSNAYDLLSAGKFTESIPYYEKALQIAKSNKEKGQIEFGQSVAMALSGSTTEAIKKFKSISENTNYSGVERAEAVEYMARMYYSFNDQKITKEIFSTQPYSTFIDKDGKNVSIAYRKLYEHSSTIYPLALSNLSIAKWYAYQLKDTTEINKKKEYTNIIKEKLNIAKNDYNRMKKDEEEFSFTLAKEKEADIVSYMTLSGDKSFGNPEELYNQAIEIAANEKDKTKSNELFTRYRKALFLTKMYHEAKSEDIISTLAPLYSNINNRSIGVYLYLKSRKNYTDQEHKDIISMSKIDENFKRLLISLGWKI